MLQVLELLAVALEQGQAVGHEGCSSCTAACSSATARGNGTAASAVLQRIWGKKLGLGDLKFRIFGREINASFWIKYFIVFNSLFLAHLKIQMKREVCCAEKHSHSQFCKHCRERRGFATSLHTVKNEIKLRK